MATWHQQQRPVKLFHDTDWTVVIDPPNQMTALYRTSSKALADVYMRNLKANNPGAYQHAYILKPSGPRKALNRAKLVDLGVFHDPEIGSYRCISEPDDLD